MYTYKYVAISGLHNNTYIVKISRYWQSIKNITLYKQVDKECLLWKGDPCVALTSEMETIQFSLVAPLPPGPTQKPLFCGMKLSELEYCLCCPSRLPEQRQLQTILDNDTTLPIYAPPHPQTENCELWRSHLNRNYSRHHYVVSHYSVRRKHSIEGQQHHLVGDIEPIPCWTVMDSAAEQVTHMSPTKNNGTYPRSVHNVIKNVKEEPCTTVNKLHLLHQ